MPRLPELVMHRDDLDGLTIRAPEFGYLVRTCRPGDAKAWREITEGRPLLGLSAASFSREILEANSFDPGGLFFATFGGRAVGVACGWKGTSRARDVGSLRLLAVRKSHRGRGLGTFLVTRVLDYLRRVGCAGCRARLRASQTDAIKVLISLGFEPVWARRGDGVRWQRVLRKTGKETEESSRSRRNTRGFSKRRRLER